MDEETNNKLITRAKFLKKCLSAGAALVLAGTAGYLSMRNIASRKYVWQIDPAKCVQCNLCETSCVLKVSAVKCVHANTVCGYCDLCGGYFRQNVKNLTTGAENTMCPTGAIQRKFVEDPYFEYTIDEALCNGCSKCVKGCGSFGNGSLYIQIKQNICTNCNDCAIARVCPSGAIKRVPAPVGYLLKG
jgi:electron transport complex protein RnfB